jgi:hypothetical protein
MMMAASVAFMRRYRVMISELVLLDGKESISRSREHRISVAVVDIIVHFVAEPPPSTIND